MNLLVALAWQPEEPPTPLSQGNAIVFGAFLLIVVIVFGYDMARTWWESNEWKRDARRRKREMR